MKIFGTYLVTPSSSGESSTQEGRVIWQLFKNPDEEVSGDDHVRFAQHVETGEGRTGKVKLCQERAIFNIYTPRQSK